MRVTFSLFLLAFLITPAMASQTPASPHRYRPTRASHVERLDKSEYATIETTFGEKLQKAFPADFEKSRRLTK